ncbi:MAG TPA: hypothetical protein VFC69_01130 [Dysgonamonadaceae bacterium]|nr:hypothetical protein [Dysgonamonadaceae bacterium]
MTSYKLMEASRCFISLSQKRMKSFFVMNLHEAQEKLGYPPLDNFNSFADLFNALMLCFQLTHFFRD